MYLNLPERKQIISEINKNLAILRYEIEHNQSMGDLSLNIYGENYFRDIFNLVYGLNLQNANFEYSENFPHIDLIDKKKKVAYQITTNRKAGKIGHTTQFLEKPEFQDYQLKIYYLLEKAESRKQIDKVELLDYRNLVMAINNLDGEKLEQLYKKYFESIKSRYSNEQILQFIVTHILKECHQYTKPLNDGDLGTVELNQKIEINELNNYLSTMLQIHIDYRVCLEELNSDDTLTKLREIIIERDYKEILHSTLQAKVARSDLEAMSLEELHKRCVDEKKDFNTIINNLNNRIRSHFEIHDFNQMNISLIIIAYFFELCDIGNKQC